MSRRRQPHKQNLRLRISKSRKGSSPILPIAISLALIPSYILPVFDQPRTKTALYNLFLENIEFQVPILARPVHGDTHAVERIVHFRPNRINE